MESNSAASIGQASGTEFAHGAGAATQHRPAASGAGGAVQTLKPDAAGGLTPRRRIRSSKNKPIPGVYSVKEYILTEDTLDNIGTLRASAAFWSAIGSIGLGFVLSALQSLSLAGNTVDPAAKASWEAYWQIGAFVTAVSYGAAFFYFMKGKSVLKQVKDNTTHESE